MEFDKQKKEDEMKKLIQDEVRNQLSSNLFSARKLTDIPTDDLMVVNRKYTNLNGTTANRPTSSIIGQHYYDTTINKPIFADGNNWRDATSSVVG